MPESVLQWLAEERKISLGANPPALKVMLEKGKGSKKKMKRWLSFPTSAQKIFY